MKKYTDTMVDIETLDTKPTAVILSIAARAFNIETGEVCSDAFYKTIKIDGQIHEGRTTSIATTLWWGDQSERAQDETFKEEYTLLEAIISLRVYVKEHASPITNFWARSPQFDFSKLNDAIGDDLPLWDYRQERDVRTILWLASTVGTV